MSPVATYTLQMITPAYCKYFARYNRWQNESVYAAAAKLPDGTRKRSMGAYFKSIHGTLNHLLVADWLWLSRMTGEPCAVISLDQELYADFDELKRARVAADDRIDRLVATLTPVRPAEFIAYRRLSGNRAEIVQPLSLALMQFFNHQTHHRGQVGTLLMQCGIDPGVTDMPAMPADFASPAFGQ